MSNLKAYLAEKYMSGPKADAILAKAAPQKKKKRKAHVSAVSTSVDSGALIQDEDGGWPGEAMDEGDDDITEAVIASDRGFKKRKVAPLEDASGWATIQEGWTVKPEDKDATPPPEEGEDKPQVVNENEFVGGLVTAKQLKKVLPQSRVADTVMLTQEEIAKAQETVYRDSTGRKIDTKAAKAEAARLKREKQEREAKKMEWGKGLVQKEEAEARRSEMEKMKNRKFARGRDDEELNEEQKGKEVWNDPAAAFMTKKKSKGPKRPEYSGPPPPPNRFGIKPGYRWDGVDRGTGFEKKLFQSINDRKRRGAESYNWSVDDM